MMKRVVFLFSAAFFAFGVDRAAAYDFKVCNQSDGPMEYVYATMVSAGCHDVTLVDNGGVVTLVDGWTYPGGVPAGQCVSGSTASTCLIQGIYTRYSSWSKGEGLGQAGGTWRLKSGLFDTTFLCKDPVASEEFSYNAPLCPPSPK